jgi:phenylpropionate dioxygenase-like ring-hydroxylating dioxygenase large terminal subunit
VPSIYNAVSLGKLMGAPEFPGNPCLNLNRTGLQNWQGLLFTGERDVRADLAGMQAARELDFSGFMLDRVQVTHYACNWKTFIEVYLEDYHVGPYHPGLGHFVTCDDLKWEYGDWWSVQTVGVNRGSRSGLAGVPEMARAGAGVQRGGARTARSG